MKTTVIYNHAVSIQAGHTENVTHIFEDNSVCRGWIKNSAPKSVFSISPNICERMDGGFELYRKGVLVAVADTKQSALNFEAEMGWNRTKTQG